jgi:twitching motility protein PilT
MMTAEQFKRFQEEGDLDFSFGYRDVRFRVNNYFERRHMASSLRLIPKRPRSFAELGLPPIIERFANRSQGLFLVTGPTGHGKSTTLASVIQYINENRRDHIITIEDPIEYVFDHRQSVVSQREVGSDALSFGRALRAALREDPNVILVGEMRDLETIEAALTAAETGHVVYATLHTNNAAQTTDRIIDVFPPHQQNQVRQQLANVLIGIISQRLIPRVAGGRVLAVEILVSNPAVQSLVREGKTHQLMNVIATSAAEGMIMLDKVLADLVTRGEITIDDALVWAMDPKALKTMLY